jgi:hypothetical protein
MKQVLKSILILILAIISIGNIALAFINPEAYFFGNNLGGMSRVLYLTNSIVSGAIIFLFLSGKKLRIVLVLSLLYFIYNIIESFMTSLILFHEFGFPTILIFGFLITIISLTVLDRRAKGEPKIEVFPLHTLFIP